MADGTTALPDGMAGWLADVGGGEITSLHRHVARREAWVVDITASDGSVLEGFLRLERGKPADGVGRLERETRIIEALGSTDVPVPKVHAWSDQFQAALFERDPGRSDIDHVEDPQQQRAVMEDFVRVMARFHGLDLDELGLDPVMDPRPTTPDECGLAEVRRAQEMWGFFLKDYVDPLTTFGVGWLERNVPQNISRISLVQGDTGPVNFMFQGDRVSSVIDWELGHYGDPMEDLGSLCLREFWNPSGGLTGLYELYEQESGIPYDRHAVQFHRVRQNVRDMMSIHYLVANPMAGQSHAWYLCYRYLADRATIEAIADNAGVPIAKPELPDDDPADTGHLAAGAARLLTEDVLPNLHDELAKSRAVDADRLVRCMDRQRRFGADMAEAERAEISKLLGTQESSAESALASLDQQLTAGAVADEDAIAYLARKAYRDAWLHSPVIEMYPNRSWSALD